MKPDQMKGRVRRTTTCGTLSAWLVNVSPPPSSPGPTEAGKRPALTAQEPKRAPTTARGSEQRQASSSRAAPAAGRPVGDGQPPYRRARGTSRPDVDAEPANRGVTAPQYAPLQTARSGSITGTRPRAPSPASPGT